MPQDGRDVQGRVGLRRGERVGRVRPSSGAASFAPTKKVPIGPRVSVSRRRLRRWTPRPRWGTIRGRRIFMARTLLDKVWEAHTVRTLPSGQTQLLIGLHLIHEVTTPQAFQMLKELKLKVRMPERTFGTLDHIIPTANQTSPYADPEAEKMAQHMYRNMKEFGLPLFDMSTGKQGIVHVIGPSSASRSRA